MVTVLGIILKMEDGNLHFVQFTLRFKHNNNNNSKNGFSALQFSYLILTCLSPPVLLSHVFLVYVVLLHQDSDQQHGGHHHHSGSFLLSSARVQNTQQVLILNRISSKIDLRNMK